MDSVNIYLIISNLENMIELSLFFRRMHTLNFSGEIVISVQPFSKFLSFFSVPSNRRYIPHSNNQKDF